MRFGPTEWARRLTDVQWVLNALRRQCDLDVEAHDFAVKQRSVCSTPYGDNAIWTSLAAALSQSRWVLNALRRQCDLDTLLGHLPGHGLVLVLNALRRQCDLDTSGST